MRQWSSEKRTDVMDVMERFAVRAQVVPNIKVDDPRPWFDVRCVRGRPRETVPIQAKVQLLEQREIGEPLTYRPTQLVVVQVEVLQARYLHGSQIQR